MFRSSGRIVEALLEDFTVMTGGGILTAVAQNTGTVTAEYTVRSYAYSMFYDNNIIFIIRMFIIIIMADTYWYMY